MTNPDSSSRDTPHSHTVYTYILDTHQEVERTRLAASQRYPPTYVPRERETEWFLLDDSRMRGGKREFGGGGGGGGHRKKAKWFNHKAVRLTTMHSMNFSGKSVFFFEGARKSHQSERWTRDDG